MQDDFLQFERPPQLIFQRDAARRQLGHRF